MARTRSPEYDGIQTMILDRTAVVFASRGYAASSIGDIAEACECSKSRLYHYFPSKEAILSSMLTEHVDGLLQGGRAVVEDVADTTERFRSLVRFFMEVYAESAPKHVVLLTCMEFLPEDKRREIIAKQRQLVAFVHDILLELRADVNTDPRAAHADTMLFFGMINWTYTWYKPRGSLKPEALADRSVDLFLNGFLRAEPPKLSAKPPRSARRAPATDAA